MSEQEFDERFQHLPETIRDKVNAAMADAQVVFKVKVGELLVNRKETAEHRSRPPAGSVRRAARCPS
jgi:hypothetical protein